MEDKLGEFGSDVYLFTALLELPIRLVCLPQKLF